MAWSHLVVGCLLWQQVIASPEGKPEVISPPPLISGVAKGHRASPSEMVAEALRLPTSATVFGRALPLADALASAQGRLQQQAVIRAYWHLSLAVGEYRLRLDENLHLVVQWRIATPRPEDVALWRTARASAIAALRSAKTDVVRAQRDLAEAAGLAANLPLPLPVDLPHVGPYDTRFQQVYASRNPAPKARLIDRVLPIRLDAIEKRAAALQASEDAWQAMAESYGKGQTDVSSLLACLADCGRQRQALLTEVCQYDQDIADYVLTVVGPSASAQELVSLLIKPTYAGPTSAGPKKAATAPNPDEPTPTLAPPRGRAAPGRGEGGRGQGDRGRGAGAEGSGFRVQSPEAVILQGAASEPPEPRTLNPEVPPTSPPALVRTVQRQLESSTARPASALYAPLATATPAVRAKELCQALHSQRTGLPQPGEPIALRDCLASVPASLRLPVLDAYWLARQLAAECQALATQQSQLAQLTPFAMERGARPGGAVEGLRLRAANLAVEADLAEARAKLLEAQFELTRLMGRPLANEWLLPTTAPHAGPYLLKLEAQPPQIAESRPVQRLATVIPALTTVLQHGATAVIDADSARAVAASAYETGTRPLDQVLPCIQQQAMETLSVLETLTAYNRAIAEYVLTVVPAAIPADQLVQTLVLAN